MNYNMNYNIKVENLFVGTKKDSFVVLNIEQKQEDGIYTLEHSFVATRVEEKIVYDIESEIENYIWDARYDGEKAMQVLSWLEDVHSDLDDLPYRIARQCKNDEDFYIEILDTLRLENEKYENDEILATCENSNGTEYMLIEDYHMMDLCDIWQTNIDNSHMVQLFSYLQVYSEKSYGGLIAREICELVEKLNDYDIDEHLQAYVDYVKK